jgi:hypothetical protein
MNFWFKTMRIYFSKVKDVGKEVEFTGVDLDDELRDILKEKKVWSNIALDDLFQSYLRKMSLVNHFSGQETERDMASIAKLRQLAKILREMLNVSCYYAVFE